MPPACAAIPSTQPASQQSSRRVQTRSAGVDEGSLANLRPYLIEVWPALVHSPVVHSVARRKSMRDVQQRNELIILQQVALALIESFGCTVVGYLMFQPDGAHQVLECHRG